MKAVPMKRGILLSLLVLVLLALALASCSGPIQAARATEAARIQQTAEALSAQQTEVAVSVQQTVEALSAQQTAAAASAQQTIEALSAHQTADAVSAQQTAEAVSAQQTAEAVSAQETAQALIAQETVEAIRAQRTAEAIQAQRTAEAVGAQQTATAVSALPTGEAQDPLRAEQAVRDSVEPILARYVEEANKQVAESFGGYGLSQALFFSTETSDWQAEKEAQGRYRVRVTVSFGMACQASGSLDCDALAAMLSFMGINPLEQFTPVGCDAPAEFRVTLGEPASVVPANTCAENIQRLSDLLPPAAGSDSG
jgi:hypothetical protein